VRGLTALCLLWVGVVWLWPPAYLTLTVDDAFYYLQVARNVAAGHGATFDRLNPTNGFHPLWVMVLAPLARVLPADAAAGMRVILTVQVALVHLATLVLARSVPVGRRHVGLVSALGLVNFYVAKALLNGQESALQYLLMALTLAWWWTALAPAPAPAPARAAVLGALAGATTLARLDAASFALAAVALPLLWPGTARGGPTRPALVAVAAGAAAWAGLVLPYLAWNVWAFGHPLPVSGAIKVGRSGPVPPLGGVAVAAVLIVALAAGWRWARRRAAPEPWRGLFPLAVYVVAETVYNVAVRGVVVLEVWYLPPYVLLAVVALSVWAASRSAAPGRPLAPALVAAVLLIAAAGWILRLNPASYSPYLAARRSGAWLRSHTAPDAVAAGWDVGIVAAHADRRLVNLDGLVNSWAYKEGYLDTGRTASYVDEVIRAEYLVQHVPLEALGASRSGPYRGVHLGPWHVVRAECVAFRSVLAPWRSNRLVFLVLSRQPPGPTVAELAGGGTAVCSLTGPGSPT
jgi:hypothetical protein